MRVFKVSPGSPAAEAGLEVLFDFILEVNGVQMDAGYQQIFSQTIQESENGTAKLKVYNARAHGVREVAVKPRKWAGNGLLGATVRFDVVEPDEHQGIRVLEVFVNSPAAHAGLVPFQDFLLGTQQSVFHDIDELVEVVSTNINQRMQVYVYNADTETVREVVLVPNNDWGGEGCIGCDIGTGLLHRIPVPRKPPSSGLGPECLVVPGAVAASVVPSGLPGGVSAAISGVSGGYASAAQAVANGSPAVQEVPPVPFPSPGQPAGMHAISTTGTWNPAMAMASQPVAAHSVSPSQAQIQQFGSDPDRIRAAPACPPAALVEPGGTQLAGASATPAVPSAAAATASKVAGRTWPPAKQSQAAAQEDIASTTGLPGPPTPGVPSSNSSSELPLAPPSTPMNHADIPGPVDLASAIDPARFGETLATEQLAAMAQLGAAVL